MKRKIILTIILILAIVSNISARTLRLNTTSFSKSTKGYYGWTSYSKPVSSDMLIVIDEDTEIVTIYSPRVQAFRIIERLYEGYDSDGDYVLKYRFVDNEDIYGNLRLIVRNNTGRRELYVDYSNVSWVYTVIPVN